MSKRTLKPDTKAAKKAAPKKAAAKPAKKAAAKKAVKADTVTVTASLVPSLAQPAKTEKAAAIAAAASVKPSYKKGLKNAPLPIEAERIKAAKESASYVGRTKTADDIKSLLNMTPALEAQTDALIRNSLYNSYHATDSRTAAVQALVDSGKIKAVPADLAEYVKAVIVPLVNSGHIMSLDAKNHKRMCSGTSWQYGFYKTTAAAALAVYLDMADGNSERNGKKICEDLLNVDRYPSAKAISDMLDKKAAVKAAK